MGIWRHHRLPDNKHDRLYSRRTPCSIAETQQRIPIFQYLALTDPHRQRRYYGTRHRKLRACRPIRPLERPGIRSIISVLRHSSQRCAPAAGRLYNRAAHNAHRHHYRHRTFRHIARSLNRITHLIPNFLWNYMHSRRLKKSAAEYRRYSR